LEKDLTEVLQTSNIHVFTNVAKGQFAAAADLQAAFGANATQEEIAIQILMRGKSLQVSEGERTQLYESCLTQVATQIATNCIHPDTGKPYTVSQIKHALTQHHSTNDEHDNEGTSSRKGKKKKAPRPSQGTASTDRQSTAPIQFTIQPHKPIKQQYLQALKYLQTANILPIVRAGMELQWEYDATAEDAVVAALAQLDIAAAAETTGTATAAATLADATMMRRTFTVDPSVYRPLQELAQTRVPGSRLEILRQQVFAPTATSAAASTDKKPLEKHSDDPVRDEEEEAALDGDGDKSSLHQSPKLDSDESSDEKSSSDSDEDDVFVMQQRSKAKKKQMKKVARRRVLQDYDIADPVPTNDAKSDVTQSAAVAASVADHGESSVVEASTNGAASTTSTTAGQQGLVSCNTCIGASFVSQSEYRAHFRSDWHRFNQKLKLQGAAAIALAEFEQCDSESFFATPL
jgi:ribosome maturation protein SDO1